MKNQGEEGGVSVEVENLVTELMENLDQFVLDPAPQVFLSNVIIDDDNLGYLEYYDNLQGALVKCRITRDRKGMDR